MKAITHILLGALLLLAACQSKNTQTQNFIPGTYIDNAKSGYSVVYDTLVIQQVTDNTYQVTRKTGYQVIRDGKLLPKHSQIKSFNAVYDLQKQELDETTTGRVFRFDAGKGVLLINQAVYHKLN